MNRRKRKLKFIRKKNLIRSGAKVRDGLKISLKVLAIGDPLAYLEILEHRAARISKKYKTPLTLVRDSIKVGTVADDFTRDQVTVRFEMVFIP